MEGLRNAVEIAKMSVLVGVNLRALVTPAFTMYNTFANFVLSKIHTKLANFDCLFSFNLHWKSMDSPTCV